MSNPNGGPNKFQPGVSGNPAGRVADSPELKELKKMNRSEMERLLNEVIHLTTDQLTALGNDKSQNGIKVLFASILVKGINKGDYRGAEFFLNRLVGKVPERFEGSNGEPLSFIGLVKLAEKKDDE